MCNKLKIKQFKPLEVGSLVGCAINKKLNNSNLRSRKLIWCAINLKLNNTHI